MPKIVKNTDLTKLEGDPGPRADIDGLTESFRFHAWLGQTRGVGGGVRMETRTHARSSLGSAAAAVALAIGGCVVAVVLWVIGAPVWAACCGLLAPAGMFQTLRLAGGRQQPRSPYHRNELD
jgi:hypothetical protein